MKRKEVRKIKYIQNLDKAFRKAVEHLWFSSGNHDKPHIRDESKGYKAYPSGMENLLSKDIPIKDYIQYNKSLDSSNTGGLYFCSTPNPHKNRLKVMWDQACPPTNIHTRYITFSNFNYTWRKEQMKLIRMEENLTEYFTGGYKTDIRDCKITVKKSADGLVFRAAAVAEESNGSLYAIPGKVYTVEANGRGYVLSYGGYTSSLKASKQKVVEDVMERSADDFKELLSTKLQQIEDASFFNQLAQR